MGKVSMTRDVRDRFFRASDATNHRLSSDGPRCSKLLDNRSGHGDARLSSDLVMFIALDCAHSSGLIS